MQILNGGHLFGLVLDHQQYFAPFRWKERSELLLVREGFFYQRIVFEMNYFREKDRWAVRGQFSAFLCS